MQTAKEAAATQAKEAQAALRRQLGAKLPASRKPRIVVSNSTNAEINGTYRSSEPHDGWPQFVNEQQYHLWLAHWTTHHSFRHVARELFDTEPRQDSTSALSGWHDPDGIGGVVCLHETTLAKAQDVSQSAA